MHGVRKASTYNEKVIVTIGRHANTAEPEHVFSITFPSPVVVYSVKFEGKGRKVVKPPPSALVDKVLISRVWHTALQI